MRKLLIKYFEGYYIIGTSDNYKKYPRASLPFTLSFLIMVWIIGIDSDFPTFSGDDYLGLIPLIFSIYAGFIHFRIFKPMNYWEGDDSQRFLFKPVYGNNALINDNWKSIDVKYNVRPFKQWVPFIINIIATLACVYLSLNT